MRTAQETVHLVAAAIGFTSFAALWAGTLWGTVLRSGWARSRIRHGTIHGAHVHLILFGLCARHRARAHPARRTRRQGPGRRHRDPDPQPGGPGRGRDGGAGPRGDARHRRLPVLVQRRLGHHRWRARPPSATSSFTLVAAHMLVSGSEVSAAPVRTAVVLRPGYRGRGARADPGSGGPGVAVDAARLGVQPAPRRGDHGRGRPPPLRVLRLLRARGAGDLLATQRPAAGVQVGGAERPGGGRGARGDGLPGRGDRARPAADRGGDRPRRAGARRGRRACSHPAPSPRAGLHRAHCSPAPDSGASARPPGRHPSRRLRRTATRRRSSSRSSNSRLRRAATAAMGVSAASGRAVGARGHRAAPPPAAARRGRRPGGRSVEASRSAGRQPAGLRPAGPDRGRRRRRRRLGAAGELRRLGFAGELVALGAEPVGPYDRTACSRACSTDTSDPRTPRLTCAAAGRPVAGRRPGGRPRPVRAAGAARLRPGPRRTTGWSSPPAPGRSCPRTGRPGSRPAPAARPGARLGAAVRAGPGPPGRRRRRRADRLRGRLRGHRDGPAGGAGQLPAVPDAALDRRAGRRAGHRRAPGRRHRAAARPQGRHAERRRGGWRLLLDSGERCRADLVVVDRGRAAGRGLAGRHPGRHHRRGALRRARCGWSGWTAWSRPARSPAGRTPLRRAARPGRAVDHRGGAGPGRGPDAAGRRRRAAGRAAAPLLVRPERPAHPGLRPAVGPGRGLPDRAAAAAAGHGPGRGGGQLRRATAG